MSLCNLAIQYSYTVQFTFGFPLFKQLGVSYALLPVVSLSGPVAGFIVQPVVGVLSDRCESTWGRRRPFILFGAIFTIIGMFLISSAIWAGFHIFGDAATCSLADNTAICPGALSMVFIGFLLMNLSINVMQGPSRAIMGDCVPKEQQNLAFSIISFIMGFANLAGNLAIFYTPSSIPFVGSNTNLFFFIGMVVVFLCCGATLLASNEAQYIPINDSFLNAKETKSLFSKIWNCAINMNRSLLCIVAVYFLSWLAYTPLQNYGTDWFAKVVEPNIIYSDGVRYGALGVACQAVMVMLSSSLSEVMISFFGLRNWYGLTQMISTGAFIVCIFVSSTWPINPSLYAALAFTGLAGINFATFNSVPFAMISSAVSNADNGLYMGVLNSACVIAQFISNFVTGEAIFFSNQSSLFIVASVFSSLSFIGIFILLSNDSNKKIDSDSSQPLLSGVDTEIVI